MNRRHFITAAVALAALPHAAFAAEFVTYSPGVIEKALGEGKTVFVDYSASWCGTCKRQGRVINALRKSNPNYDAAMVFVKVDWDDFGKHSVTKSRNIPRRSTLLVLRGDKELGRIVAGTGESEIKALMDTGL
ncbi:thioredoxin family protein [uncultured Sulfitobacter sp.]|uniref:thioredoxin family protein n=1 Tax=uncultured Sulfitobacter sp. TaxID=191468 RepID=UPI002605A4DA|nr:thioredoxin family protein [uncultured Sulfitobacter sp.]